MSSFFIWLKDKKTRSITVSIISTVLVKTVKKAYFCECTKPQDKLIFHRFVIFFLKFTYIISFSEWDTEDVVFWLETNGLHAFTQGFKGIKRTENS